MNGSPMWCSSKKANRKMKMCVDFSDLKKACPKDSFPLHLIDIILDDNTGHKFLSFMDAYSRYNYIRMNKVD